jgi:alpha-L-rhamnosidase
LNTGIFGLRFLFEVLTRRGRGDLALDILRQDSYPGFGDLISRGATTLWEWWGEESHNIRCGPRSMNHPMMGGYDNWFFNTLAGIVPREEHPGFSRFTLAPHPIAGISWLRAHHDSVRGRIESNWTFDGRQFQWDVTVPQGSVATAILPLSRRTVELQGGTHRLTDQA